MLKTLDQSSEADEQFFREYRKEMARPECKHIINTLAAIGRRHPISIGCHCADEARCHRSVLKQLLGEAIDQLP